MRRLKPYLLLVLCCFSIQVHAATKTAIFAGGCFWCMEADFEKLPGVVSVISGYDGGSKPSPSYQQVSSGTTDYREVIKVAYDPAKINYQGLLDYFWQQVDPLDGIGQFCDKGRQYLSGIYYLNDAQKTLALASLAKIKQGFKKTVYTDVMASTHFYPAEDYHQNYYKTHSLKYRYYRYSCGRDKRLKALRTMK